MPLSTVLLDVDGTLVLSNEAHAEAWSRVFRAHDYDITPEQVRPLMGMGGDKLIPTLVPGLRSSEGEGKTISSERQRLFLEEYAPHLAAAPGSRALVERMQQAGLKLVVASSAKPEELAVLLKIAHVDDLLHTSTTSSDAEESKPAPDIVEAALQQASARPETAILIGDAPYDVESAGKAGVRVIAVRCGGFSDGALSGALAIYENPADILTHFETSALAG